MRIWQRRGAWIAAAIVALLLAIQVGTYALFARHSMPQAGLRQFRLNDTLKGCEFVIIDAASWAAMTPDQQAALEAELRKFVPTIYHAEEEVPVSRLITTAITQSDRDAYEKCRTTPGYTPRTIELLRRRIEIGYRILGYRKGIQVRWGSEGSGLFWMYCYSGYWISGTGAAWRTGLYVWVLGRWVQIRDDGGMIS
jgi:hypothetical protein